eukprot:TRINITY_DN7956_c0_g2_i2.p1 TRINITY_DN7956_c0_g2~~TRINITY_DN7956_c0_g2_i2.p1  ORF type:complete len:369 (-),score=14.96 TRINITY_DN7956_c0_g2_i2:395-1501(-)
MVTLGVFEHRSWVMYGGDRRQQSLCDLGRLYGGIEVGVARRCAVDTVSLIIVLVLTSANGHRSTGGYTAQEELENLPRAAVNKTRRTATYPRTPMRHLSADALFTSCQKPLMCERYVRGAACQCNDKCEQFGNCCVDYLTVCFPYIPLEFSLSQPSNAPVFTFYMYRAQNDNNYPPLNVNTATLGGILWYLHNEIVNTCESGGTRGIVGEKVEFGYRRFKIRRILRYKVTTKATEPLYRRGMNFGTRVAFDSGKNTGSWEVSKDTRRAYEKYGFHVGCNVLGQGPYPLCDGHSDRGEGFCPISYPKPIWYSLPGQCPSEDLSSKTDMCKNQEPGGFCRGTPTGQGNCTYTYEPAGVLQEGLLGVGQVW